MRRAGLEPGRHRGLARRAIQIRQVEQRDAQVDASRRERRIDPQRLAKGVGRRFVVELLEPRRPQVVGAEGVFARRLPARADDGEQHADQRDSPGADHGRALLARWNGVFSATPTPSRTVTI